MGARSRSREGTRSALRGAVVVVARARWIKLSGRTLSQLSYFSLEGKELLFDRLFHHSFWIYCSQFFFDLLLSVLSLFLFLGCFLKRYRSFDGEHRFEGFAVFEVDCFEMADESTCEE